MLPTGSDGLTTGKYASVSKVSVSHRLNNISDLSYNLGYYYFGYGKGDISYSASLGVEIGEKAGIYLETYGEIVDFKEWISNFDTGITYMIKKNI